MSRRVSSTILGASLICATSNYCLAEGRIYVGIDAGYASMDSVASTSRRYTAVRGLPQGLSVDGIEFHGADTAAFAFVGYNLNSWAAIELNYGRLGSFHSKRLYPQPDAASIDLTEFAAAAKLKYSLSPRFAALWYAGVNRTHFKVAGNATLLFAPGGPPFLQIPFASPPDKTGMLWGLGLAWNATPHVIPSIDYRQYRCGVLNLEAIALSLTWAPF